MTPQANPAQSTGSIKFELFCNETSVAVFTTSARKLSRRFQFASKRIFRPSGLFPGAP
jgi:hypothetical protein